MENSKAASNRNSRGRLGGVFEVSLRNHSRILLTAKSVYRIDACCASRWKPNSEQRRGSQQNRDADEYDWIASLNTIKEARNELRQSERGSDTDQHADNREPHTLN